jgi:hypothetical protein
MTIRLSRFAHKRHWDPTFRGTKVEVDPGYFAEEVDFIRRDIWETMTGYVERAGYAPFCRLLFIPNFTQAQAPVVAITPSNEHLLRSEYKIRAEGELPYLDRHFMQGTVATPRAEWLCLALYTAQHLIETENDAVDFQGIPYDLKDWVIVNVMGVMEPEEQPMSPATMGRNALGPEFGGSGVPIDKAAYLRSVEFWSHHAVVS